MTPLSRRFSRRSLLSALPALSALPVLGAAPPGGGAGPDPVAAALARAARPLATTDPEAPPDDLRYLGRAVGDVPVVALGEAAHGAHELFALKHRVFRHLVAEHGFTTFALETGWGGGLRIDAFLRRGTGDLDAILAEEFGGGAWPWYVEEYAALFCWMRAHNVRHPAAPVRFMGNDLLHPRLPRYLFDLLLRHARRHAPGLVADLEDCYRELRGGVTTAAIRALPAAERAALAAAARRAARLLAARRPAPAAREEHAWAVRHALVIADTLELLDLVETPGRVPEAMRFRDEMMARNTVWWYRHTGGKVLLSAHNGHVAYRTYDPADYPRTQGAYLRDALGGDYLVVGTTFGSGAATTPGADGGWVTETFAPPRPDSSEAVLERAGGLAGHPDFVLDLRTVPGAARAWLRQTRPTRDLGKGGEPYRPYVLADGLDVLIHLHAIGPAHPLA
jgi:erythromycin esterase